jgi:hypothetical protein
VKWFLHHKWRTTSWIRIPPIERRHLIDDETFRYTIAALTYFAPRLSVNPECRGSKLPRPADCVHTVDRIDHLMGCGFCCSRQINRRHNNVNYAIRRQLNAYDNHYAVEPKGYSLTRAENQGGADGPDGCFESTQGIETCIDVHVSHPRVHVSHTGDNKSATENSMCVVKLARDGKIYDYSGRHHWDELYPDTPVQFFTISSYGVLHPETLKDITQTWLPMLKDKGACFIRNLQIDLWFTTAKSLGAVLRISQVGR